MGAVKLFEEQGGAMDAVKTLSVTGLWTMRQLADYLNLPVQSLYDYRYRKRIDESVFIRVGRKLRVDPNQAVNLALKGELITLD